MSLLMSHQLLCAATEHGRRRRFVATPVGVFGRQDVGRFCNHAVCVPVCVYVCVCVCVGAVS